MLGGARAASEMRRATEATARPSMPPAGAFADAEDAIERTGSLPAPPSSSSPADEPRLTLPEDATAPAAAAALADALDRVPAARRYAEMPLSDLADRGPRIARRLWATLPEDLKSALGTRTIGQLLDERRSR
jgi:hypothetical protein